MVGKKRSAAAGATSNQHSKPRLTPISAAAHADGGEASTSKPVRVYADGIFDLFHFGHARALEQAKKLFPNTILVVGVCNDQLTHKYKGKTVMTEEERYESLRHCKWVDEVIRDAPWVITLPFLEKHNIDYVAHDDLPYEDKSGQTDDVYGIVKQAGKFKATQRTDGISTSDIILRVLKDYNEYVLRNLSRGYTRKQLGISLVKEQRIRASANIKKFSQQLKEQRLRVADGITKRMGLSASRKSSRALSSSRGPGRGLSLADALELRGKELADVIRRNGEELALNMEQVMDKVMRGQVAQELQVVTDHVDKYVSGSIRCMEEAYAKFERMVNLWRGQQRQARRGSSSVQDASSPADAGYESGSGSGSGSDSPGRDNDSGDFDTALMEDNMALTLDGSPAGRAVAV